MKRELWLYVFFAVFWLSDNFLFLSILFDILMPNVFTVLIAKVIGKAFSSRKNDLILFFFSEFYQNTESYFQWDCCWPWPSVHQSRISLACLPESILFSHFKDSESSRQFAQCRQWQRCRRIWKRWPRKKTWGIFWTS